MEVESCVALSVTDFDACLDQSFLGQITTKTQANAPTYADEHLQDEEKRGFLQTYQNLHTIWH